MRRATLASISLIALVVAAPAFWLASRKERPVAGEAESSTVAVGPATPPMLALRPRPRSTTPDTVGELDGEHEQLDGKSEPAPWTLVVTVIDAESEKPVVGADVREWSDSAHATSPARGKTDDRGCAKFPVDHGADAHTRVFADGYLVESSETSWYPQASEEQDIRVLLHRGIPVDGRVVDSATGRPIAGASVYVVRRSDPEELDPTDERGCFHVPGVEDDEDTTIGARAPDHVEDRVTVRASDGKVRPEDVVVRLTAGGAVVGVVLSPDGTPVDGARLRLFSESSWFVRHDVETDADEESDESKLVSRYAYPDWIFELDRWNEQTSTSGADGAFRIDGVEFGVDFSLRAGHAEFADARPIDAIRVESAARERRVIVRLRRPSTVLVHVRTASGAPLPDRTRVRLFLGHRMESPRGEPADGRYEFVGLPPGTYHPFAEVPGLLSVAGTIRVAEGSTVAAELTLATGSRLSGTVVDPEGNPVMGAEIHAAPVSENDKDRGFYLSHDVETTSDSEGKFDLVGLAAGPVYVVADFSSWRREVWLVTKERIRAVAPANDVRVVLQRLGRLRLRVLGPDRSAHAGKASIWTRREGESWDIDTRSNERGVLTKEALADGRYELAVEAAGFAAAMSSFEVRDGDFVDVGDISLDSGVAVVGRVVDSAGRPIAGADVDAAWRRRTRTDATGGYTMPHCPRGPFTIRFSADGYVAQEVVVDGPRSGVVEARLLRPSTLRATLRSAMGALAPGETIWLRPAPTSASNDEGRHETDPNGRLEVQLQPGRHEAIWKDAQGVECVLGSWASVEGESNEVELVIPAK